MCIRDRIGVVMNNSYNERSMKIIDLKKTILEDNDADADWRAGRLLNDWY